MSAVADLLMLPLLPSFDLFNDADEGLSSLSSISSCSGIIISLIHMSWCILVCPNRYRIFAQDMETRQLAQSSQLGRVPIETSIVDMEVDDTVVIDDPEEPECTLNEDELRQVLKVNSNKCIEHMRILPKEASRFNIPLCQMVYMPLV